MSESPLIRAKRAIPWGMLGMLALVGSIERGAIRDNLALVDPRSESWSQTARQLKRAATGFGVLCFGDSMAKCGLIPRVFQDRTGRPAFNFAVVGGSAPSSYFLLRRALNAGARPSTIVVDFNQDLFGHGPASKAKTYPWAHLVNLRESVELCGMARDPDLFAWITLARLLPSVKNRDDIRSHLKARLKGEVTDRAGIMLLLFRNWNFNQGAMIDPKRWFEDNTGAPVSDRMTSTWRPDPTNETYFHKFLDLAARRGITVVWLLPPVSPGTQIIWENRGDEARFDDFIRVQLGRHRNVVVLDARHAGYEATVFHDQVHLDRDGALTLSNSVADLLDRGDLALTASSRWVALPAFHWPARGVPLEDLGQSRIATLSADTKPKERR